MLHVHASIENALTTAWRSDDHSTPTAEEVRANGVLKNVRRSADSLTLVVDCKDIICMATITPHFPEDTLILLRRHFSRVLRATDGSHRRLGYRIREYVPSREITPADKSDGL